MDYGKGAEVRSQDTDVEAEWKQERKDNLRIYTSLFTKMVASKEKKKKKNTYIQKYTINKNGSRNRNKGQTICTICTTGCYNTGNGNIQKPAPCWRLLQYGQWKHSKACPLLKSDKIINSNTSKFESFNNSTSKLVPNLLQTIHPGLWETLVQVVTVVTAISKWTGW